MDQTSIFAPIFAMVLLTMIVWIYMYVRRIAFIHKNNFNPQELTPVEFARLSPPEVSNPSDNLKNLFEIPVLFYLLSLYLFVTNQVDTIFLVATWIFVIFRCLHSVVHCTINIVMLRFWLYFVATVSVWFIAIRAAFHYFWFG
ncbi:MAPEG family protein [Chloroflexi bacterium TSY]|nr:MAPEG family protein [Chloroflexi bacterium TSY]